MEGRGEERRGRRGEERRGEERRGEERRGGELAHLGPGKWGLPLCLGLQGLSYVAQAMKWNAAEFWRMD